MFQTSKKMVVYLIGCFLIFSTNLSHAGTQVKNVILMISDGQGVGTVMAADYYNGHKAAYESFPQKYFMTTYSMIGYYNPETALEMGKATGVVTSVQISHTTPAGMVAHTISREKYSRIANEMVYESELKERIESFSTTD